MLAAFLSFFFYFHSFYTHMFHHHHLNVFWTLLLLWPNTCVLLDRHFFFILHHLRFFFNIDVGDSGEGSCVCSIHTHTHAFLFLVSVFFWLEMNPLGILCGVYVCVCLYIETFNWQWIERNWMNEWNECKNRKVIHRNKWTTTTTNQIRRIKPKKNKRATFEFTKNFHSHTHTNTWLFSHLNICLEKKEYNEKNQTVLFAVYKTKINE